MSSLAKRAKGGHRTVRAIVSVLPRFQAMLWSFHSAQSVSWRLVGLSRSRAAAIARPTNRHGLALAAWQHPRLKRPQHSCCAAVGSEPRGPAPSAMTPQDCEKLRRALLDNLNRGRLPLDTPVAVDASMEDSPARNRLEQLHAEEALECSMVNLEVEKHHQGVIPLLLVKPVSDGPGSKHPAVIFLHGTESCKEGMLSHQVEYAKQGFVAVSMDARYHGRRVESVSKYNEAMIGAAQGSGARPMISETVWDVLRVVDYLQTQENVSGEQIGIWGDSLGGTQAWFAAAADTRIKAAALHIGVQGFQWAVHNEDWQGRVARIPHAFAEVRKNMKRQSIDSEIVGKTWDILEPGLMSRFDAPASLPLLAPRPVLITNGELDPRCPLEVRCVEL
eukprot:scaffold2093_cov425-Prasinococcus_capsulatus_cf.AAC.3